MSADPPLQQPNLQKLLAVSELRGDLPLSATLSLGARAPAAEARPAPEAFSGIRWSRRFRLMLRITDAVLITLTVIGASQIFPLNAAVGTDEGLATGVVICASWTAMMLCWRTHDPRLIGVGTDEYKRVVQACGATVGSLAVLALLLGLEAPSGALPTFLAGLAALLAGRWSWRQWLGRQRKFGHYLSRVIVLGRSDDVRYVIRQIGRKSGAAYDVVGAVLEDDSGAKSISVDHRYVPVLCGVDSVPAAAAQAGADTVIVAGHMNRGSKYVRELGWQLEASDTKMVLASALTNVGGSRLRMRPVEGLPLMHVESPHFTGARHCFKRAFDIIAASLALTVLGPLLIVFGVAVRLDSPGKALFCQQRVGRRGDTFCMYKFRSMVQTAEDELAQLARLNEGAGPLFKLRNDPRVTRVGAWLRRYSLDELPQFLNVLKGDMSLVGPRPPLPNEVADYKAHVHRRLFIKPGVTGLWQVSGRSDLDWDDSVRLDLYYVENWSLTGDLIIMWRTFKVMVKPTGAY